MLKRAGCPGRTTAPTGGGSSSYKVLLVVLRAARSVVVFFGGRRCLGWGASPSRRPACPTAFREQTAMRSRAGAPHDLARGRERACRRRLSRAPDTPHGASGLVRARPRRRAAAEARPAPACPVPAPRHRCRSRVSPPLIKNHRAALGSARGPGVGNSGAPARALRPSRPPHEVPDVAAISTSAASASIWGSSPPHHPGLVGVRRLLSRTDLPEPICVSTHRCMTSTFGAGSSGCRPTSTPDRPE